MNLEEIKARLAALANGGSKKKDMWKPKDKHVIRLLPYPHGDEPFIELGFHYELGATKTLLCPKFNFGKECAVCEFADKLRSWNDEDGNAKKEAERKADFEIFKKIQVKQRYYVPMIERGHESEGPKFWSFGKTIYEILLNMCLDEEMNGAVGSTGTGVLTDVDKAFDLKIDFKNADNKDGKGNAKNFPITEVKNSLSPTALLKSKKEAAELIEKVPNMNDVYPEVSSSEVKKAFMQFINSNAADPEVKDTGKEYKSNSAEKPVEGTRSLDEAFGDLLDK